MSRSPFVVPKAEEGFSRRAAIADTNDWMETGQSLTVEDAYGVDPLNITPESDAKTDLQLSPGDQVRWRCEVNIRCSRSS